MLDISKLLVCQGTQHSVNLLVSWKIGANNGLECEWYVINLFIDTAFGVAIQFILYIILLKALEGTPNSFETGNYYVNNEFSPKEYIYQMFVWVSIVFISKLISFGSILVFYSLLNEAGIFILGPLLAYPKLKLLFVMVILPTILNLFQFWFTDNFLKSNKQQQEQAPKAKEFITSPIEEQSSLIA